MCSVQLERTIDDPMTKRSFIFILAAIQCCFLYAQTGYEDELLAFQENLNMEFRDRDTSPLPKKKRKKFKGHDFFSIDKSYQVTARFERFENPETFQMKTTTGRLPDYDKYGRAVFQLNGKEYELIIYQSHHLRTTEEYKDYLFLPFTDLTNGETTYGGGRYLDLSIPPDNEIVLDFNKAYHPSCVYNYNYSCPIPPPENHLETEIKAGIRLINP